MNGCSGCGSCLDRARMAAADSAPSCSDASAAACCGTCCAGVHPVTPRAPYNRPGLPAIDYRAGTHGGFLQSMIARLASRQELTGYTTRAPDDPGIVLLDGWALAGDIVTFYTERAANEGYLGTATQPDSLTLLGRLVNYQPRPAVGASGYLAFTMDPGATGVVPAGSQARSVAGPNELPQTFEVSETIQARADWNQLAVRLTRATRLSADTANSYDQLTFVGASPGVQAGTRLVFDFPMPTNPPAGQLPPQQVRVVTTVTPDFAAGRTFVGLAPLAPVGVDAALDQLKTLIRNITDPSGTALKPPAGPVARDVVAILDAFTTAIGAQNPDVFAAVADLVRELTEEMAIAANRVPAIVATWLAGPVPPGTVTVTDVLDQATATLSLIEQDQRRLAPDIAYLQSLANVLTCPKDEPGTGGAGAGDSADCDRAAPLMTAAAILPALRRPPSQPPATPAALSQAPGAALDPQSSAVTALLAAADPRLAGIVSQAIGRQMATAPPATASVTALTTKATPPANQVQTSTSELLLDGTPDTLVPGSWFVSEQINEDGTTSTFTNRIKSAAQGSRVVTVGSGQNATTTYVPSTTVTLSGQAYYLMGDELLSFPAGLLTVYYGGSLVQLADEPITEDVGGSQIELAQTYDGLYPGQRLVVTGERTDIPGTPGIVASEVTMVGGIEQRLDPSRPGDATLPVLVLATPLAYTYKRATVTINGNVAAATQGESRTETLGSGTAGQAGQSFPLKQVSAASPLTWLPSDNALGASDTLTVRVNGVEWHETDDLSQAGPNDRVHRTVVASDGSVSVAFGDGVHGSRLPTGQENVTAAYRVGGGRAGDLPAGRITQLASHPLGVNAVTNPLPTSGGADGDTPGDMRSHAALRCLALDRLLSVQDYADFTSARAGIGQAAAASLTDGDREVIYLTIAGAGDAPLDVSDLLVTDLRKALAELGDPYLPVRVGVRELLLLVLSAGIKVGADYSYDLVEPAVRGAALAAGGFASQALGQPVYLSQIVTAMQAVPGVEYVDVNVFGALPATADPVQLLTALLGVSQAGPEAVQQVIDVRPARFEEVTYTVGKDPTGADDTLTSIALRYGITLAELVALNPQLTSAALTAGAQLVVARGIRPAQLALLSPEVPQTLLLRRIP